LQRGRTSNFNSLKIVKVHDIRLPYVVSIDFWQYTVEWLTIPVAPSSSFLSTLGATGMVGVPVSMLGVLLAEAREADDDELDPTSVRGRLEPAETLQRIEENIFRI